MDEWEKYELHHRKRLAIKPGLTGMWQVSGRSDITDFEEVVELDTKYIAEWCLKSNRISLSQSIAYIAIFIYLWTVLESTVFTRIPQAYNQYELHIFWSWKAFFVYHENEMLKENILNCILLMPYGCLLPVALDKRISWKRGLMIGMGTSFVIELLQLITCRGLFEFDDIIHNGFGCMMGAVLGSWCWLRMLKKFKMPRKPHAS